MEVVRKHPNMPMQNDLPDFYNKQFYESEGNSSNKSAYVIVPLLMDLINPSSVVDVGCGTAAFLREFKRNGVKKVLGIDGSWIDQSLLEVPDSDFFTTDLRQEIDVGLNFDLVISLEVAEHIDRELSEIFVKSLTNLGSMIVFSAAIPFQGGTHHVNEQWPEYWAKIFEKFGYISVDCLRQRLWHEDIDLIYAQNTILYIKKESATKFSHLLPDNFLNNKLPASLVHPKLYLLKEERRKSPLNKPMILPKIGNLASRILNKIYEQFSKVNI